MFLKNMLIRKKILYSTLMLTFTLLLLMYCSLRGVYAYRSLTISLRTLSTEIRQVQKLHRHVGQLQTTISQPVLDTLAIQPRTKTMMGVYYEFLLRLDVAIQEFDVHRELIQAQIIASNPLLATTPGELQRIDRMIATLRSIESEMAPLATEIYVLSSDPSQSVYSRLIALDDELHFLSEMQTDRMETFRAEMRSRYRSWIAVIVAAAVASLINVGITFWFFRHSIVKPFKMLLVESEAIAGGEFDRRIHLNSNDELSDLASAMNSMTDRFVKIRDNLNHQVQQRTKEVVRSEQLASVGFLAAGVAHEINNPLASIAWSAEALESRLHEALHDTEASNSVEKQTLEILEVDVLRTYLKRIQDEAFRCKGITERLLDFSRLGESSKKQETDIHEAISDVCELVRHLGQYRNRKLKFEGTPGLLAWVSPTEFKQVVLNLLTNALDAVDDGDEVDVSLSAGNQSFLLRVTDRGCGMSPEVMKHLFEPFFTRRRDGRGTGLGLSISYRIVQDHGGTLVPSSRGEGLGSTMLLKLPLGYPNASTNERLQAA